MREQANYFKGRGAQVQTANPFLKQQYVNEHVEGLDEPLQEYPFAPVAPLPAASFEL